MNPDEGECYPAEFFDAASILGRYTHVCVKAGRAFKMGGIQYNMVGYSNKVRAVEDMINNLAQARLFHYTYFKDLAPAQVHQLKTMLAAATIQEFDCLVKGVYPRRIMLRDYNDKIMQLQVCMDT